MNLVKQMLTEVYQVPAVLPGEANLAEIACCLLKGSLVSGAGAAVQETLATRDARKGRCLQKDCYPWRTRLLPTRWCVLSKIVWLGFFLLFFF